MAEVVKLVQGSDELDLTDSSNIKSIRVNLVTSAPKTVWHTPDQGERRVVRDEDTDRNCTMILAVYATDEDELQNNLVELRRWLREARRAEKTGDTNDVYLQLQKDGATNAVKHRIKTGWVDDSQAHYVEFRKETKSFDVQCHLVLAPYGESTSTITLKNDMLSSPHFVEDSLGTALIADGWNLALTPAVALSTARRLIGQYSQSVLTDSSTSEGIYSDTAPAGAGEDAVGYVWINATATGNDPITITLRAGNGTILDTETFTPASPTGYDKSTTGQKGFTWYRYVVTVNIGANTGFRLYIIRDIGDATHATGYRVDGCYIQVDETVAPDAWMSARAFDNRNDITTTNENYLNYIDVWGVPGDAPALVETELDFTTAAVGSNTLIAGRVIDGTLLAADERHWFEDDEFTTSSDAGSTWTRPADAGRTDGYYRHLAADATTDGWGQLKVTETGDAARALYHNPKHVYGIVRTSSTVNTFDLAVIILGTEIVLASGAKTLPSGHTNVWDVIDFGVLNLTGLLPLSPPNTSSPTDPIFRITIYLKTASSTADIDAVLLMPVAAEHVIARSWGDFASADVHIRGVEQEIIDTEDGYDYRGRLGSLWQLEAGNVMNRLVFCTYSRAGGHAPTDAASVTLTITPRTRHLLGTI